MKKSLIILPLLLMVLLRVSSVYAPAGCKTCGDIREVINGIPTKCGVFDNGCGGTMNCECSIDSSCSNNVCVKKETPWVPSCYDITLTALSGSKEHPLSYNINYDYENNQVIVQMKIVYRRSIYNYTSQPPLLLYDEDRLISPEKINIWYDVVIGSYTTELKRIGSMDAIVVTGGNKIISNEKMVYNQEKRLYEVKIPLTNFSIETGALSYRIEFSDSLSSCKDIPISGYGGKIGYVPFVFPDCQIGGGEFKCGSDTGVGIGKSSSLKYTRDFPAAMKGIAFRIMNNLNKNVYNLHLNIEGCDSFDYEKNIEKEEIVDIGGTRKMPYLNCSILGTMNYKKMKIAYKDNEGSHLLNGWLFFMIPEARYVYNCSEIKAEEITLGEKCWEKLPGTFKFCWDKETNVLYYGSQGSPYYGTGGILYKNMESNWQFLTNTCKSIKEIAIPKCADTEEEMRGKYETKECEVDKICFRGTCIESGACPARIKFETDGSIIAPDHYPTVFIKTYDSNDNPIESIITFYEYFNSEKTGEGIFEIPKEGFKTGGLEKEKFEAGSYKIMLNSPVSGCETEEVVKFTIKESMSMFDRISELFRWLF